MIKKLTKDEIIKVINNLSVLELNDLIKGFEKKLGISVNDINNINTLNKNINNISKKKEKTKFSVILTEIGTSKISVIKIVRELTGLGLKECKNLVDNIPKSLKDNLTKVEAETFIKKIESIGAKALIK
ncbi:50S ribosomal protein L7/L12 [Candidatus Zinderia endosymbiont of Aphrophora alni]|uniref:50S ribosomal protein L7/L12 n=1 Tax=Candidatus Zinderia endosymbiont of Aphrophora alni TaxID=3077951 RepID=UPI0030CF2108